MNTKIMKTTITFLLLFVSALFYAQNKIYVHTVTADNTVGTFQSLIDHPDLNNKPNAQVVVKQHWRNGTSVYNNNPIGVAYSTSNSKWVIYNENQGNLPSGAFFNVFIGDNTDKFFVHVATSTNQGTNANSTVLDHPDLNNKEDSFVFISKNVLGSGNTVYNPYNYASAYNLDGTNKRELFESSAFQDIPNNAAFNVVVGTSENSFSHTTASSNTVSNWTKIDHPELNNNPNATFIFEQYWGTASPNNGFINKNLGVWYDGTKWTIFTQDLSAMPTNVRFSILIALNDIYTAIPDQNFEQALIDLGHDSGSIDGKVLTTNISSLNSLDVSDKEIADLTGIEDFVGLTTLSCHKNNLTTLDVSKNIALTTLYCRSNQLTTLDVSKNTGLTTLYCYSNKLTTLDVSKNTGLTTLYCYKNKLTTLDVSKNTGLTTLSCYFNQLTTLDVSKNTGLTTLSCFNNQLTTLDLSKNTGLTTLSCSSNQLTTLDLSKNTGLTTLRCFSNKLTTLDLSKNTGLTTLDCYNNQLTTLDLSKNTGLTSLYCRGNQLATLDVSKNTGLTSLDCRFNSSLEAINVKNGNNTNMSTFNFTENTNLTCIQVDDVSTIPASWNQTFSYYSADCYDTLYTAIPDQNFEQALIALEHDDVKDGKVLTTNISSLTSLDVSEKEITDLTGIEDFVALKNLQCHTNQLATLDVSKNTALDNLNCSKNKLTNLNLSNNTDLHTLWAFDNQFTTLDVSNNIALKDLNIPRNQLITIDVSNNIHLINLYCGENLISSLDISNNTALKLLWAFDNKLTTLDVSKNIVLTDLRILNNPLLEAVNLRNGSNTSMNQFIFNNTPKLTCIQVDDGTINTNWNQSFTGYSTDCFDTLSTEDLVLEKILQVYPNPVQETLYIKATNELIINEIQLYDVRGKMIRKEKEIKENRSLKELNSGIYFVKILTNKGVQTRKIIKE